MSRLKLSPHTTRRVILYSQQKFTKIGSERILMKQQFIMKYYLTINYISFDDEFKHCKDVISLFLLIMQHFTLAVLLSDCT